MSYIYIDIYIAYNAIDTRFRKGKPSEINTYLNDYIYAYMIKLCICGCRFQLIFG